MASLVVLGCGASSQTTTETTGEARWLYVQTAQDITLDPSGDEWLVRFDGIAPSTVAFTDRPDRESRTVSTSRFLRTWHALFGDDPPNASLTLDDREQRTIPLTIETVRHDEASGTAWYVVSLLGSEADGLPLGESLGRGSLFIDDAEEFENYTTQETIRLQVRSSSMPILVMYAGINGNRPGTFGNSIQIWEGTEVSAGVPPIETAPIRSNATAGDAVLAGFVPPSGPYTIGYLTGSSSSSVAATATVLPGGSTVYAQVAITVETVETSGVVLTYTLPEGIDPLEGQHWVGVWQGGSASYERPPLARVSVEGNNDSGVVEVNFQPLRGEEYAAGYFTSPTQTALAATATFLP